MLIVSTDLRSISSMSGSSAGRNADYQHPHQHKQ